MGVPVSNGGTATACVSVSRTRGSIRTTGASPVFCREALAFRYGIGHPEYFRHLARTRQSGVSHGVVWRWPPFHRTGFVTGAATKPLLRCEFDDEILRPIQERCLDELVTDRVAPCGRGGKMLFTRDNILGTIDASSQEDVFEKLADRAMRLGIARESVRDSACALTALRFHIASPRRQQTGLDCLR